MGNIVFSLVSFTIYLIVIPLISKEVITSDVVFPNDKVQDELDPHRSERSLGILRKYIKGIVRIGEGLPEPGPGNSGLTIRIPTSLGQIFKPDRRTGEYEESNIRPPYRPQPHPTEEIRPSYRPPDVNNGGYRPSTPRIPYQPVVNPGDHGEVGGGYGSHGNIIYFTTESSYHTTDYHGGSVTGIPYEPDHHVYPTTRRPNHGGGGQRLTTYRPPHNVITTRKPSHNNNNNNNGGNSGLGEGNECGVRRSDIKDRIIGGRESESSEFPWQVALKDRSQGVFCGGAVINKRWIITAAHCVVKLRDLNSIRGLVGSNRLDEPSVNEIQFTKMVTHRSYRSDTFENDIALLQSKSDLPLFPSTATINTICLPKDKDTNFSGKGTIAGWGRTSEGGFDTSETLLAADVDLMDDSMCKEYYADKFKEGKQLCAGIVEGGKDSCQGDSGGPLIKEVGNKSYLVGIVSYGRGCGRRRSPGVYTKVSHYVHWIRAQI